MRHRAPKFGWLLRSAGAMALVLGAGAANAHALDPRMGDFYGGMFHPLTALEHALPILALGLLAGQCGLARAQSALLAFPLAFAIGAVCECLFPGLPDLLLVNIGWAVVLGALVASALPMPSAAVLIVASLCGLSHGYANGAAMTSTTSPVLFISGLAVGAFLALAYSTVFADYVLRQKVGWLAIAVRVTGSWITAIGILVLSIVHRTLLHA